jgi:hypothetical protein
MCLPWFSDTAPPLKKMNLDPWSSSTSGYEIHPRSTKELFGYIVAPDSRNEVLVGMDYFALGIGPHMSMFVIYNFF